MESNTETNRWWLKEIEYIEKNSDSSTEAWFKVLKLKNALEKGMKLASK